MIHSKKICFSLLSAALLMASCTSEKKTEEAEVVKSPTVRVEQVTKREVSQIRDFTATVEAFVSNNISPQAPLRIDEIYVEVGDKVRKGQVVAKMDDSQLVMKKLDLDKRKLDFKRMDELYSIGSVSQSDWETMATALKVEETAYNNLIENTKLISPISGIITARNYDAGDMYGQQQPILTVQQITPVKLMINVSEAYFQNVKKGMPVDITMDVYGDEKFEGKVSLVYPTIDPTTRSFPVEITISNQDQRVRPGMFARATLNFGTVENVVVPDLAVIKQAGAGDRFVYVLNNDGTVSYRRVELGQRLDDAYELRSGVESGEKVVVAGQSRLKNGIKVEVEK